MIFENPRLPSEKILEGYMHSEDGDHDSQYQMRVRSFYSAIKRNQKKLPSKGKKVLDIGTAGGAFLEAAKDFGYDAYGLEPSVDLVERGNKRGLKIFQGTADSNGIGNQKFDLICLWDVIEHLPDPRQSLLDVLTYLEPNGTLLINFPNIGTVQAKLAGKRFWWIISVHLHHFANGTLDQLCESLGLKAVSKKRYFQILEFGYLVEIASKLGVPLASQIHKILPNPIKRIPIPYYASQTTAIYRVSK